MFVELSGSTSSGARGVHALEGAETTEEWWGYDQEGYDNSVYAQEEDPDNQWEWDVDQCNRFQGENESQERSEVSPVWTSWSYGQAVQGRYE